MGIIVVSILAYIFYQDMRYRGVYWFLFPVLLVLLLICGLQSHQLKELVFYGTVNCTFLIVQIFLLAGYFSLKQRRFVNITAGYLGWGDILFLIVVSIYLSPLNYVSFYLGSLTLTLLLMAFVGFSQNTKIPLAGFQAILFAFLLITDWNIASFDLSADSWLIQHFTYGYTT